MDKVKQAIYESIDKALSKFDFVDKEKFYEALRKDGVKPGDISEQYEQFHTLLAQTYGVNHFKIEREIIKVLHERAESGTYTEENEIPAFTIIVKSYFKETDEAMRKADVKLQEAKIQLEELKKKQQNWNDRERNKKWRAS